MWPYDLRIMDAILMPHSKRVGCSSDGETDREMYGKCVGEVPSAVRRPSAQLSARHTMGRGQGTPGEAGRSPWVS